MTMLDPFYINLAAPTIFALMFMNAFSVFPSEPLLIGIGATVRANAIEWQMGALLLLTAFLGFQVGSFSLYLLAKKFGEDKLISLFSKLPWVGRYFLLLPNLLHHLNSNPFTTYGILRNVTPIRSIVSAVAGLRAFPPWRFALYTLVGSLPWFFWWSIAGYLSYGKTLWSVVILLLLVAFWATVHNTLRRYFLGHN